jgi:hypothetical protein
MTIVDDCKEAYTYSSPDSPLGIYKGGTFFKGLSRPWMGIHTIDTVRRDAAEQSIMFETEHEQGSEYAEVELVRDDIRIVYKIDLYRDVIDQITFFTDQGGRGNLKFSYLQSIDEVGEEFEAPRKPRRKTSSKDSSNLLWLVQLLEDSLN